MSKEIFDNYLNVLIRKKFSIGPNINLDDTTVELLFYNILL